MASAPNDPNNPQDQNPVTPGQFVSFPPEENTGVFKEPLAPPPPPPAQPSPQPPLNEPVFAPPQPQTPPPNTPIEPTTLAQPSPPQFQTQPDPSPFTPPTQAPQAAPTSPSSGGSKLRLVLIAFGLILMLALIGGIVWFFALGKATSLIGAKTSKEENAVEAPSFPPSRTTGGFSELPPATSEAGASPSAQ